MLLDSSGPFSNPAWPPPSGVMLKSFFLENFLFKGKYRQFITIFNFLCQIITLFSLLENEFENLVPEVRLPSMLLDSSGPFSNPAWPPPSGVMLKSFFLENFLFKGKYRQFITIFNFLCQIITLFSLLENEFENLVPEVRLPSILFDLLELFSSLAWPPPMEVDLESFFWRIFLFKFKYRQFAAIFYLLY